MSAVKLEYFDTPGRADAIRIALNAAGIEFEDFFFTFEGWAEFKSKTDAAVYKNGLPVLTIEGKKFSQSVSQLRFAGRKANLYSDDLLVAMRIDEILDCMQDIFSKCPSGIPDKDEFKKAREEYGAGKMKNWMQRVAECADESSTEWLAGTPDISIADLSVWQTLFMIRTGDFTHIPADYADQWPKLVRLEKSVPEHAIFKSWVAKKASKK